MAHVCALTRKPSYARWSCGALRRDVRGIMTHACSPTRRPSHARCSCGAPRRELREIRHMLVL
eukprot:3473279-Alexandrium_andersonii.AAC.1